MQWIDERALSLASAQYFGFSLSAFQFLVFVQTGLFPSIGKNHKAMSSSFIYDVDFMSILGTFVPACHI